MCMDMKIRLREWEVDSGFIPVFVLADNLNVCNSQFCTSAKRSNNI